MGRKLIDFTGQKFGRLTVIEFVGRIHHASNWRCSCDCGNSIVVPLAGLRAGLQKSCGCYKRERMGTMTLKHGARAHHEDDSRDRIFHPIYKVWDGMKQRCYNPATANFMDYGGRGITICDEWVNDFEAFMAYVGPRPSPRHSIDRYPNNDGNYEPGNVRWATQSQQARNRRSNRLIEVDGKLVPLVVAAKITGLPRYVIAGRLNAGWPLAVALSSPLNTRRSHVDSSA